MNVVKQAVLNDCLKLVTNFASRNDLKFEVFCDEWKEMQFQHIYSGLLQCPEMISMTEEIFYVAKTIFFSNRSETEKIGALYLLYAIYFKQPTREFCKIRLHLEHWMALQLFISKMKNTSGREHVVGIFYKLVASHAFRFVLDENDFGFDDFYQIDKSTQDYNIVRNFEDLFKNDFKEINDDKNSLLADFEKVQERYNEIRLKIKPIQDVHSQDGFVPLNIVKKMKTSLNKIEEILKTKENITESVETESVEEQNIKRVTRKCSSKKEVERKNEKVETNSEEETFQTLPRLYKCQAIASILNENIEEFYDEVGEVKCEKEEVEEYVEEEEEEEEEQEQEEDVEEEEFEEEDENETDLENMFKSLFSSEDEDMKDNEDTKKVMTRQGKKTLQRKEKERTKALPSLSSSSEDEDNKDDKLTKEVTFRQGKKTLQKKVKEEMKALPSLSSSSEDEDKLTKEVTSRQGKKTQDQEEALQKKGKEETKILPSLPIIF